MLRQRGLALVLAISLVVPLLVACGSDSSSSSTMPARSTTAFQPASPTQPVAAQTSTGIPTASASATATRTPSPTASPTLGPSPTSATVEPEPEAVFDASAIDDIVGGMLAETDGYVAVSVQTADGTVLYEHDSWESMEAASIYKLPVMVEIFRQIEAGEIDPSTGVLLSASYFAEGEDSIGWDSVDSYYDVETLLFAMIAQSSNVAAYALLDLVGNENVNATMAGLGLDDIEIRWSPRHIPPEHLFPEPEDEYVVEPEPENEDEVVEEPEEPLEEPPADEVIEEAPADEEEPTEEPIDDAGEGDDSGSGSAAFMALPATGVAPTLRAESAYNVITAHAVSELLVLIVNGEAISPAASEQMLDLLYRQEIPGGLPAQLPDGVVAHKTGYLADGVINDAGIIQTPGGTFVAVVLTEGVPEDIAYRIMSEVGRLVYELGAAAE